MARIAILIGSLIAAFSFSATAGYVNLKPPPGWSQGGAAAASTVGNVFRFADAQTQTTILLGRIGANAALTVAGSEAAIPVAMKLGAKAAEVAAVVAFNNPSIFVLGLVTSAVLAYYDTHSLSVVNDKWVKKSTDAYCVNGSCYQFSYDGVTWGDAGSACSQGMSARTDAPGSPYTTTFLRVDISSDVSASCIYQRKHFADTNAQIQAFSLARRSLPSGSGIKLTPVALPEFVATLAPTKLPDQFVKEFPGYVEWPVDLPYINPETGDESTSFGRPFLIPTGLPTPTADPNVWNQPAIRVSPAPTPSAPWRVDTTPVNVPQSSGTPKTSEQLNPKPVTTIDPVTGQPVVTNPDTGTATGKDAPPPGLCAEFPDILACQKLGTPDVPDLPTQTASVLITPDSGWTFGPGACPADRYAPRSGLLIASFQPTCDFMTGLKPVVIAMAWLAAALILLGLKGGE